MQRVRKGINNALEIGSVAMGYKEAVPKDIENYEEVKENPWANSRIAVYNLEAFLQKNPKAKDYCYFHQPYRSTKYLGKFLKKYIVKSSPESYPIWDFEYGKTGKKDSYIYRTIYCHPIINEEDSFPIKRTLFWGDRVNYCRRDGEKETKLGTYEAYNEETGKYTFQPDPEKKIFKRIEVDAEYHDSETGLDHETQVKVCKTPTQNQPQQTQPPVPPESIEGNFAQPPPLDHPESSEAINAESPDGTSVANEQAQPPVNESSPSQDQPEEAPKGGRSKKRRLKRKSYGKSRQPLGGARKTRQVRKMYPSIKQRSLQRIKSSKRRQSKPFKL